MATTATESSITAVCVFPGRAQLSRLCVFSAVAGQNRVAVRNLPNLLDRNSIRVHAAAPATIHDVTIAPAPRPVPPASSPALAALIAKRNRTVKAVDRCHRASASLQTYITTLSVDRVPVHDLPSVLRGYESAGRDLDHQLLGLDHQLADTDAQIDAEREALRTSVPYNDRLTTQAIIGVFADKPGTVEITFTYAVHGASWTPAYDIRVDLSPNTSDPITLIYKASITQTTGEDWSDVPLTLETATPTMAVHPPTLEPWTLSFHKPLPPPPPPALFATQSLSLPRKKSSKRYSEATLVDDDDTDTDTNANANANNPIPYPQSTVSFPPTNLTATFQVPGLISIPSDTASHSVTIAHLRFSATMSWISIPKKDPRTRLSAKIKNASPYTLLRGPSSIYVDGSYIARTEVPLVSPDESFDCPLGLDPSIRITYHPLSKKYAQSGFYQKTAHYVFSQNVTVYNTKPSTVDNVRVVDQFPISEDDKIQVRQVSPTLPSVSMGSTTAAAAASTSSSSSAATSNPKALEVVRKPVQISKGIQAIWDGADDPEVDSEHLGKNGKFIWVCSVPPQSKINLLLQWEVIAPPKTDVVGLMLAVCYP